MDVKVILAIIGVIVISGIISGCGSVIGKNSEGKRWAKAADKRFVEFSGSLYEVNSVNLDKPIDYDK